MSKLCAQMQISFLMLFLIFFSSCKGQDPLHAPAAYSVETEKQIVLVENNLGGRIKIEGEHWNIMDRLAYYKFNGVSVAVIENYEVVWAKGYGWADINEKIPVTENTLFQAASVSKSINAMAVLKLAQDKKLDLNADINTYLTSWKFPYDAVSKGKKITTLNLLTHTAGISGSSPEYVMQDTIPTLLQTLNGEAKHSRYVYSTVSPARSVMEPGLEYRYSNNGIGITQLMVSDITGFPYEQYIAKTIFQPLGMLHSTYSSDAIRSQQTFATGYLNGVEVPGKHVIIPAIAAGGLWTTPSDLAKFIVEMQLSVEGRSNKILSKEIIERMLTPYIDSVAAGVFIKDVNGEKYFQHSGSLPGFNSQYYASMKDGNGVVIMVNAGNATAFIQEILNSVAEVYKWKDFYQPVYKKAIALPDSIMQKYTGVYTTSDARFTLILKKDDDYSLYADGIYSKMYFTDQADFFNVEFPTEKHFLIDAKGAVTGYTRTLNGVPHEPSLMKVNDISELNGSEDLFGTAGWAFLENKNYYEALACLKRGNILYPSSLMMQMNLAHAYLFADDYASALQIYRSHMDETINDNILWQDIIASDFLFFKNNNFSTAPMNRIFAELKLQTPDGYE